MSARRRETREAREAREEAARERAAAGEIAWLYALECDTEAGKVTLGDALLKAYLRGREGRA